MKLKALLSTSEKLRKLNSRYVKIKAYKEGRDKNGFAYVVAKTYSSQVLNVFKQVVPTRDRKVHVTKILFIDAKLNVKVSCSCEDYCFSWEYSNHHAGASDIYYSNGEAPTVKAYGPGLCKHLIAISKKVMDRYGL
jgi:hypothetical protein